MQEKSTFFRIRFVALLIGLTILTCFNSASWGKQDRAAELFKQFKSFTAFPHSVSWEKSAPQIKRVEIQSSADSTKQPALFYDSGSARKKPLLVVLHSWSDNYRQKYSVPYGVWSVANDWVFIHPDYRGVFNNAKATGSELAVRDILDAVAYAEKNARIDTSRIYLIGFSGGAMMALNMAGRHPGMWTAVAAWVPVFSLNDWYPYVSGFPNRHYKEHIIASCGGAPIEGTAAAQECRKRSPVTYLKNARGKKLRIYIGHGIHDDFVQPGHSLRAYNELAGEKERISEEAIEYINAKGKLPADLVSNHTDPLYQEAGKPLLFRRTSENVTVSLFRGGHDVLYDAGLQWLSLQSKEEE
jgi:predicted esterase